MKEKKYIVFDLDGTLIDTGQSTISLFSHVLKKYNVDVTMETIEKIRSESPKKLFSKLMPHLNSGQIYKDLLVHAPDFNDATSLFSGIEDLLKQLKLQSKELAVWTGRDGTSAKSLLKYHKIDSYFSMLVSGTCVENNKPHEEGLVKVKDFFKCHVNDMLMIGDHVHDVMPSSKIGVANVHVTWQSSYKTGDFSEFKPDVTYASVESLASLWR